MPWPWTGDHPHGNVPLAPGDTLASIVSEYAAECHRSHRPIMDAALDERAREPVPGGAASG